MNLQSGLSPKQVLQRRADGTATAILKGECAHPGNLQATLLYRSRPLPGWNRREVGGARRGHFTIKLHDIPTGGPYELRLECGTERFDLRPFFVGDVWILAGQSNMEGAGNLREAARPHPRIQAFSMRREWRLATEPLHVTGESPDRCHHQGSPLNRDQAEVARQRAVKGAGVGLHFARERHRRSGVPQGLICTAHGDTSLEQWSPARQSLSGDSLYASLLTSVRATGQKVAGVLWYQGENETSNSAAPLYTQRMAALIAACRKDLRQPRLPWAMVQLGRVIGYRQLAEPWNSVQEQQRLLPERIANLATVSAIDLALDDGIHLAGSAMPQLARRLARTMDQLASPHRPELPPPQLAWIRRFHSIQGEPGPKCALEIGFHNIGGALESPIEPAGFTLHDARKHPLPYIFKTTLHGSTVRLHLTQPPPLGTTVSHGAGLNPICTVNDGRDFCLPVFLHRPIESPGALLPFVTRWKRTPVLPWPHPLEDAPLPRQELFSRSFKTYDPSGFINEHATWQQQTGLAYFQATLRLKRPQTLQFLMGYDAPFRLWLNRQPFFLNAFGDGPCVPDESAQTVALPGGAHQLTVGMDVKHGRAWGFYLRFLRQT